MHTLMIAYVSGTRPQRILQMFADIAHLQSLFSHWPAADVWTSSTDGDPDAIHFHMGYNPSTGEPLPPLHVDANHVENANWNYGSNFAGGTPNTVHNGGKGMFGDSYIMDTAYSYAFAGDAENFGRPGVTMCQDNGCSRNQFGYTDINKAVGEAYTKYLAEHYG